jgi:hypothetical protein
MLHYYNCYSSQLQKHYAIAVIAALLTCVILQSSSQEPLRKEEATYPEACRSTLFNPVRYKL